jgi:catechol 2,3-dioxygenase-like lactoylglutathione lyase family enzyme
MPVRATPGVVDCDGMTHGIRVSTVNISSSDPSALARFWAALLGLDIRTEEADWVVIGGPGAIPLAFELDEHHQPPVWPSAPGRPPTQLHLEVQVDDLDDALAHALACGARLADHQPQQDVRVCLDPAGHPFCLWVDPAGQDLAHGAPDPR